MYICKYIHEYLMEHNSLIVPDLGRFTIIDKPPEVQEGTVFPSVKTVALDCENADDDHVLTGYLATKENITTEQAAGIIRKFYKQFFLLAFGRILEFEKFGKFLLNETKDIVFIPVSNFFDKDLFKA